MLETISIKNPFNLHVHLRTGPMLAKVLPFTAVSFSAAVAIGNLFRPVKTAVDMKKQRAEIDMHSQGEFESITGILLAPDTTPEIVEEAYEAGAKFIKNIPFRISTNAYGVPLEVMPIVYPALAKACELEMPLLIHPEVEISSLNKDPAYWQARVNESVLYLEQLIRDFPDLKLVMEHANTRELINFIISAPENVKGTLTVHHQMLIWNDIMDAQGEIINRLNFCLPCPAFEDDRQAVIETAASDDPAIQNKFGYGSDSAPHYMSSKRGPNPSAGVFTEPVGLPLLAEIFEQEDRLENLQDFVSPQWAPEYYGFKPVEKTIVLKKEEWEVPFEYEGIPIFWGKKKLSWKIK